MTIEKTMQGAWCISDIIDGYLVRKVYYFYTKREAIAAWKAGV